MTLRLILTRHAKSNWDDPLNDDHSRPLSPRGIQAASAIGHWLADKGYVPDLVLCSTARRTRQTWELIETEIKSTADVTFDRALYLSSPDAMLNVLHNAGTANTVMVLGHNPGTGLAAAGLAVRVPAHAQFNRHPTCATTVLDFDASDWKDVGWHGGSVVDFVVPRDL